MTIRCIAGCLAAFSVLVADLTFAQEPAVYLGYKVGAYDYSHDGRNDNDLAHGAYAGYRFGKYLDAEMEYLALNETSEAASFEGNMGIASLKPKLPLGQHWELYAKIGWAWVDGDINPKIEDAQAGVSREAIKQNFANYGLGVALTMGRFQGRLEYQFDEWYDGSGGVWDYKVERPDFGVFSLGVNINF